MSSYAVFTGCTTTLLPSLPLLASLDKKLLQTCWDLGFIPGHVVRQAEQLRCSIFNIAPWQQRAIQQRAKEYGIDDTYLQYEAAETINYEWCRLTALIIILEDWKRGKNSRCARVTEENCHIYDDLMVEYSAFSTRFSAYLKQLNNQETNYRSEAQELLDELGRHLWLTSEKLLKNFSEYISRTIFAAEYTENSRRVAFIHMGFDDGAVVSSTLTKNQFAALLMSLIASFFLLSMVEESGIDHNGRPYLLNSLYQTFILTTSYGLAVLCALYPKGRWSIAEVESNKVRPVISYFCSGLMAVAAGLLAIISLRYTANTVAGYSMDESIDKTIITLLWSYPYLLQVFAVAFGVAWISDNRRYVNGETPLHDRLFDFSWMAQIIFSATVIVYAWMEGVGPFQAYASRAAEFQRFNKPGWQQHMSWFLVKGLVVGCVIGWLVPFWYRLNRAQTPTQRLVRFLKYWGSDVELEARQLKAGELRDAVVATGVIVAASDDSIDQVESDILRQVVHKLTALKAADFSIEQAMKSYGDLLAQRMSNKEKFEETIFNKLSPMVGRKALGKMLVHMGIAVAMADGVFEMDERKVMQRIISLLKLKESDFDLQALA